MLRGRLIGPGVVQGRGTRLLRDIAIVHRGGQDGGGVQWRRDQRKRLRPLAGAPPAPPRPLQAVRGEGRLAAARDRGGRGGCHRGAGQVLAHTGALGRSAAPAAAAALGTQHVRDGACGGSQHRVSYVHHLQYNIALVTITF